MLSSFCRMSLRSPTEPGIARAAVDICCTTFLRVAGSCRSYTQRCKMAKQVKQQKISVTRKMNNRVLKQLPPPPPGS